MKCIKITKEKINEAIGHHGIRTCKNFVNLLSSRLNHHGYSGPILHIRKEKNLKCYTNLDLCLLAVSNSRPPRDSHSVCQK